MYIYLLFSYGNRNSRENNRYSKKPFHCFVCTVTLFLRITIRQDRTPVATHLPLAFTKSSPQACASRNLPWQLNINTRAGHTPQIVRQSGTVRPRKYRRQTPIWLGGANSVRILACHSCLNTLSQCYKIVASPALPIRSAEYRVSLWVSLVTPGLVLRP